MTNVYKHLTHYDIPQKVRNRIIANIEHVMDMLPHDEDNDEDVLEDLIEIAYDSYHIGWQAGFIDDTQPDPDEIGAMEMAKDLASFNPGGTK